MSLQVVRYRTAMVSIAMGMILSGLVMPGPIHGAELKVYNNVDIDRFPYRSSPLGTKVTQNQCFNFCLSQPECKAVVFTRKTQRCRLYKNTAAAVEKRGTIAGFIGPVILPASIAPPPATQQRPTTTGPSSGGSQPNASGAGAPTGYAIEVGWDYPGADLRLIKEINFDVCIQACNADNACVAFNYDLRNNWCFLKQFLGARTPDEKGLTAIKKVN